MTPKSIAFGLIGPGLVGSALLDQIAAQGHVLQQHFHGLQLSLVAICTSRLQLLAESEHPISFDSWQLQLQGAAPANLDSFSEHMAKQGPGALIVDCTASQRPTGYYSRWLAAGLHVITPNKQLGAGPWNRYQEVMNTMATGGIQARFLYEATVGAGLPVISTLQAMVLTGDQLHRIEGVFSGSLSYIFNTFGTAQPFSAAVTAAKDKGYTEPDPREDLSGMDVARKAVILARECRLSTSLEDVAIDCLVPAQLQSSSADEFQRSLPQYDGDMEKRRSKAEQEGKVLRFVGIVDLQAQKCSAKLEEYPTDHPFAGLAGSDNVFALHSQRYSTQPLVIRGAGAGAAVTAAGVFADMLQAAQLSAVSRS